MASRNYAHRSIVWYKMRFGILNRLGEDHECDEQRVAQMDGHSDNKCPVELRCVPNKLGIRALKQREEKVQAYSHYRFIVTDVINIQPVAYLVINRQVNTPNSHLYHSRQWFHLHFSRGRLSEDRTVDDAASNYDRVWLTAQSSVTDSESKGRRQATAQYLTR